MCKNKCSVAVEQEASTSVQFVTEEKTRMIPGTVRGDRRGGRTDAEKDRESWQDIQTCNGEKRKKKGAYTIDWNWRTKKRRQAKTRRAALVLCVLLVLIGGVSLATRKPKNSASDTDSETVEKSVAAGTITSKVWTRDEEGEITSLVQQYYTALLANDTVTLGSVLDESVVLDEEQVAGQGDFIEAYEDFIVYTADGEEKGEYAVYISCSMQFAGIETAVPELMPAYVRTDEEGNLRLIPYSFAGTTYFDDEMNRCVTEAAEADDFLSTWQEEVQTAYDAALAGDEELNTFVAALQNSVAES